MTDPFDKANAAKYSDAGWDGTVPARVDITGGVLKQYPSAVVERRQFDGGTFYEVRFPDASHRTVRMGVEWGDDEAQALDVILSRIGEGKR